MLIFAIDDERSSLNLLRRAIRETASDAEIQTFHRASEVLKAVRARKPCPDAVFCDIELPGMSGLELALQIKSAFPRAKIVFVTGYSQYAADAFRIHANGYILKPVTPERIREELESENEKKRSPSQAISTALAASMGTGNIVGVAAALGAGGAGSVLWMIIAAFFGMSAAYAENRLGAEYHKKNGTPPMSYISKIPFGKYLSVIYAAACIAASFFMGNMIQGNALCSSARSLTNGNIVIISAITAVLLGAVIAGGKSRISAAAERIIPAASALYILSAAAVIFIFRDDLGNAVSDIFRSAFGIRAAGGGVLGYTVKSAVSTGMRRGIFSNEAGLGSSVLVHSSTEYSDPHTVGCWAACEVFIDTVICCTLTALALLVTGADCTSGETDALIYAFSAALGGFGRYLVPVSMILFAGASVLGWCCCGETALHSITDENNRMVTVIYRAAHIIVLFIGGISEMSLLWGAADIINWVMLMINLTAVIILTAETRKER